MPLNCKELTPYDHAVYAKVKAAGKPDEFGALVLEWPDLEKLGIRKDPDAIRSLDKWDGEGCLHAAHETRDIMLRVRIEWDQYQRYLDYYAGR